jgi:hypothetical protein
MYDDKAPPPKDDKVIAKPDVTGVIVDVNQAADGLDLRPPVSVMSPTFSIPVQSDLVTQEAAVGHDVQKAADSTSKPAAVCDD